MRSTTSLPPCCSIDFRDGSSQVCQLDPAPCWTFTVADMLLAILLAAPIAKPLAGEPGSTTGNHLAPRTARGRQRTSWGRGGADGGPGIRGMSAKGLVNTGAHRGNRSSEGAAQDAIGCRPMGPTAVALSLGSRAVVANTYEQKRRYLLV
jgi:hypothetical protein